MDSFSPQTISQREYPPVENISLSIPSFNQPITQTDYPMARAEQGSYQALRLMAAAVRGECPPDYSGYRDDFNIRAANQIVTSSGSKNAQGTIAALFYFVRDKIIYIDHPPNRQVVQDCRRTLELGSGDCVSKSVCLATLLAARQIGSRFIAQHPSVDQAFNHVYIETLEGLALDSIADGKSGRPLFDVGHRQKIPDGEDSFETSWKIFD